jgi:hypothetical protein
MLRTIVNSSYFEILGGWPLLTTRPKNKHAEHAAIILQDIVFLVMPSLFLL